jgi:hypothetical protein
MSTLVVAEEDRAREHHSFYRSTLPHLRQDRVAQRWTDIGKHLDCFRRRAERGCVFTVRISVCREFAPFRSGTDAV